MLRPIKITELTKQERKDLLTTFRFNKTDTVLDDVPYWKATNEYGQFGYGMTPNGALFNVLSNERVIEIIERGR